jgi:hypothetical protein
MQYQDKHSGEIVDIEKININNHIGANEDHPYQVRHTDGSSPQFGANYYITEERLKAQFVQKEQVRASAPDIKEN